MDVTHPLRAPIPSSAASRSARPCTSTHYIDGHLQSFPRRASNKKKYKSQEQATQTVSISITIWHRTRSPWPAGPRFATRLWWTASGPPRSLSSGLCPAARRWPEVEQRQDPRAMPLKSFLSVDNRGPGRRCTPRNRQQGNPAASQSRRCRLPQNRSGRHVRRRHLYPKFTACHLKKHKNSNTKCAKLLERRRGRLECASHV